jgi:GH18 family chitinase
MVEAHEPLDFINLTTYNFRGHWSSRTGHHANLRAPGTAPQALSAAASVEMWTRAGIPTRKFVLGVPFYGRGWGASGRATGGSISPTTRRAGPFRTNPQPNPTSTSGASPATGIRPPRRPTSGAPTR